jgi:cytochrome c biogenesis protein CcdA
VQYVEALEHVVRSAGITDVAKYDYYGNDTALSILSGIREKFAVPPQFYGSVTTIIDGRCLFEGYFPIDIVVSFVRSGEVFDRLIAAEGLKPDTYRLLRDGEVLQCSSSERISDCLSSGLLFSTVGMWALVLLSGFVNGLNPCALAVLAYFVGVISVRRSREETLKIGALYVLSVYLVYVGIGIGLMRIILSSGYVSVLSKALGAFIIVVGAASLKIGFQQGSSFPRIPKRLVSPIAQRFSRTWIQKSALAAALLFGGIVAVLEFPCTGGVYAAIVGMLSAPGMDSVRVLYLLAYSLMFVMPLVILLVLSYSVAGFPSLREIAERHRSLARLASAMLLLGLGLFLLIRN